MKTLLLALTLLFSTAWLQAQDQPAQDQQSQPQATSPQDQQAQPQTAGPQDQQAQPQSNPDAQQPQPQTAPMESNSQMGQSGDQTSVEGCLQVENGNYTLTTSSGMTYQLQGDNAMLTKHVGHEIRVKGMTSATGTSAGSATANMGGGSNTQPMLQVEKVKHVSAHCNTTGMSK